MIEFMNFDTTRFPNFGSGLISRFSALWRRDIYLFPRHGRARPGHPRLKLAFRDLRVALRLPGDTPQTGRLLRPLCSILRPALLAVLHALRIEHATQDVVTHAGQV